MKRIILLALCAAVCILNSFGDIYSPNRPLYTLETRFFSIVFPSESRSAARYLATFADSAYDEIAGLLGTEKRYKISVVFSPDSEELNGSFTNYPYLKILLYQAAIDPDSSLGSFKNDLYKLFYHELTHAVSLTIRGPLQNILAGVFGTPLGISQYTTPLNFSEGVTVSLESRDGFGRAADPLAGAVLRQDIIEGRWKSFMQTMGAYDDAPGSTLYYLYGGYFSKMLQDRHGMEKYAELWRRLGSGLLTRPFDDIGFWTGHFSQVYGLTLDEAWEDLKNSMGIRVPVIMKTSPLRAPAPISAICATSSFVYYADSMGKALFRYDPATREETKILDAFYIGRLAASPDGTKLLISTYRIEEGMPRLELRELNLSNGRLSVLPHGKLRDASYSGKDVVAVRTDGYQTDIVAVDALGIHALLEGSERIAYSNPLASGDGAWIYALARIDGINSLVRVNPADRSRIQRLETPQGLGWIRYLSGDNGILRLGWDDDKQYRLVEIEGDTIRWQTTPMSGGVHDPVATKDDIFYLARFSDGQSPCLFPRDRDQLGMAEAQALWKDAEELRPHESPYDREGASGEKKYNEAFWMLPRFWHPTLSGGLTEGLTSAGIALYMQDPIERLNAQFSAEWNFGSALPQWSIALGINAWAAEISIGASDSFSKTKTADPGNTVLEFRNSSVEAGIRGQWLPFSGAQLVGNLAAGALGRSDISSRTDAASAYRLWDSLNIQAIAALGYGDFEHDRNDPDFSSGYRIFVLSRNLAPVMPATDSGFSSGLEINATFTATPFTLDVFGAFTPLGTMRYGSSGFSLPSSNQSTGGSASYPAYAGFESAKSGAWYAQGEGKLRIIHAPIQKGLGSVYANRLYIEAGARGAVAPLGTWHETGSPADYNAAVFCRMTLTWTPVFGMAADLHPQTWIEIWSNPETGKYGIDFSLIAAY